MVRPLAAPPAFVLFVPRMFKEAQLAILCDLVDGLLLFFVTLWDLDVI